MECVVEFGVREGQGCHISRGMARKLVFLWVFVCFFLFCFLYFETEPHYVTQTGLKLRPVLLPQPPRC